MAKVDTMTTGRGVWRPVMPAARRVLSADRPLVWLLPVVLLLLAIGIYPLVYNLYNSFREFDPVSRQYENVGWENWSSLFTDPRVRGAVANTAVYVAVALVIEFTLGLAIAMLLNTGPWGAGLWQSMLILPMVVPPTIAAVMFEVLENADYGSISWVLYGLGILDKSEPLLGGTGQYATVAVLLPDIWQWTPFFVLILLAGLKALPTEPLEAAQVDGASAWQRFTHIVLPMLRPMIAVAVLFRLVDLIKVFDYIYVITNGGPGTDTEVISYYAYTRSFQNIEWGYGSTLGLAILVLAIVVANIYVKLFRVEW